MGVPLEIFAGTVNKHSLFCGLEFTGRRPGANSRKFLLLFQLLGLLAGAVGFGAIGCGEGITGWFGAALMRHGDFRRHGIYLCDGCDGCDGFWSEGHRSAVDTVTDVIDGGGDLAGDSARGSVGGELAARAVGAAVFFAAEDAEGFCHGSWVPMRWVRVRSLQQDDVGRLIWLNLSLVKSMEWIEAGDVVAHTHIHFGENEMETVAETPEQILERAKGAG